MRGAAFILCTPSFGHGRAVVVVVGAEANDENDVKDKND
jgi:hypothetical protein